MERDDCDRLEPPRTGSVPSDRLEQLVAEGLERIRLEGPAAIEAMCQQHPEHAQGIRKRMDLLQHVGLAWEPQLPQTIGGFRLLKSIGVGGMGVVYLAEQEALHRHVALKLIRPDQLDVPGARERFLREVETIAQLKHPGIIPIYTVGEEGGVPFFAMEHVTGCSLAEVIARLQGRPAASLKGEDLARLLDHGDGPELARQFSGNWVGVCFQVIRQVAEALDHAHQRGILHRDIKPSNIMLTRDGRALLLDFGLASTEGGLRLTRTGSQVGSLPYMPRERFSETPIDCRADIYSLGVTLYEMLTLRLPYQATTGARTIQLILKGTPDRIQSLNPAVPWDAETVCLTAMEQDPQRRYASAAGFARDLLNVLELRPIAARRPGTGLRVKRWMQRHPARAVGLMSAFVILVLGPIAFGLQQRFASERLRIANEEITRNAALVAQRADALMRLSDVKELQDLVSEADGLWPRRPPMVERYRAWLARAYQLHDHLPQHIATLAALRSRAAGVDQSGEPEFTTAADRWWYVALSGLVRDLRTLEDPDHGLLRAIEQRLQVASTIERATVTELEDEWSFARQHIAESSLYRGLDLEPQLGLIPLEPDPQSGLFEFWLWESGERPVRDERTGRYRITSNSGLVLVLLPGGRFTMGAQSSSRGSTYDVDAEANEGPPHPVTLAPFFMSKYEMTQGQWVRLTGTSRSWEQRDDGLLDGVDTMPHPATLVRHAQCVRACQQLGLLLPTEAQWEYAARGGTTSPRWVGADKTKLKDSENVADQRHLVEGTNPKGFVHEAWDDGFWGGAPVGSFLPNPFGLHDVLGNVWEWCRDCYGLYRMPERPGDGERIVTESTRHMIRGGCWEFCAAFARASWRMDQEQEFALDALGLRPSRPIDALSTQR